MVEPDRASDVLAEGEHILLVARSDTIFKAIRAESEALRDS
jgi:hypothetical protein